jgi:hypothetical protein
VTVLDLHALGMDDVVVFRVFCVQTELQLLEARQIVELEYLRVCLRRLLDAEPHVRHFAHFLDASVHSLVAFVEVCDWELCLGLLGGSELLNEFFWIAYKFGIESR